MCGRGTKALPECEGVGEGAGGQPESSEGKDLEATSLNLPKQAAKKREGEIKKGFDTQRPGGATPEERILRNPSLKQQDHGCHAGEYRGRVDRSGFHSSSDQGRDGQQKREGIDRVDPGDVGDPEARSL